MEEEVVEYEKRPMSDSIAHELIMQAIQIDGENIFNNPSKKEEYKNTWFLKHMESETIHHYTSMESFFHIISNQTFFATNSLYLNDKEEYNYQIKFFEKALDKLLKIYDKDSIEERILLKTKNELWEIKLPNSYVICFSAKQNDLNLWQNYGNQGQGVSMCFDRKVLPDCFHLPIISQWINYNTEAKENDIYSFTKVILNLYAQLKESVTFENETSYIDWMKRILLRLAASSLGARTKHHAFEYEQEYRLLLEDDLFQEPLPLEFMPRKNKYIIPYVKLNLRTSSQSRPYFYKLQPQNHETLGCHELPKQLPLKEVMLGPCVDRQAVEPGICAFLESKGYENVVINCSDLPYRAM